MGPWAASRCSAISPAYKLSWSSSHPLAIPQSQLFVVSLPNWLLLNRTNAIKTATGTVQGLLPLGAPGSRKATELTTTRTGGTHAFGSIPPHYLLTLSASPAHLQAHFILLQLLCVSWQVPTLLHTSIPLKTTTSTATPSIPGYPEELATPLPKYFTKAGS